MNSPWIRQWVHASKFKQSLKQLNFANHEVFLSHCSAVQPSNWHFLLNFFLTATFWSIIQISSTLFIVVVAESSRASRWCIIFHLISLYFLLRLESFLRASLVLTLSKQKKLQQTSFVCLGEDGAEKEEVLEYFAAVISAVYVKRKVQTTFAVFLRHKTSCVLIDCHNTHIRRADCLQNQWHANEEEKGW